MRFSEYFVSFLHNKFHKFNNTGAQKLDSIYHRTLKLLQNCIVGIKTLRFSHLLCKIIKDVLTKHY